MQKNILWVTKYGVKFHGLMFPGGIEHSLSNSVASILLAGLYFEYSNDLEFFIEHLEVLSVGRQIIDEDVGQRQKGEPISFNLDK